jgi:hypothetical protein
VDGDVNWRLSGETSSGVRDPMVTTRGARRMFAYSASISHRVWRIICGRRASEWERNRVVKRFFKIW